MKKSIKHNYLTERVTNKRYWDWVVQHDQWDIEIEGYKEPYSANPDQLQENEGYFYSGSDDTTDRDNMKRSMLKVLRGLGKIDQQIILEISHSKTLRQTADILGVSLGKVQRCLMKVKNKSIQKAKLDAIVEAG